MSSGRVTPVLLVLWLVSVWLVSFGLVSFPLAARAATGSIEEVADCAIRNLPPAAHAHAKLTASVKGKKREIEIDYWSRTSDEGTRQIVIAQRNAPEDSVSAYLFSDGDAIGEAWAFSKKDGKAKRMESRGPNARLFGSNVSLEDFARFARVVFPGQVRRLDDSQIDGRKTFVVETKPAPDAGSEYSRIVTQIDREWCLILKRDNFEASYEKGEKPRKTYSVAPADVKVQGKFANGTRALQTDAVDGSSTEMQILELELPASLDESLFTPDALSRAAH